MLKFRKSGKRSKIERKATRNGQFVVVGGDGKSLGLPGKGRKEYSELTKYAERSRIKRIG